MLMLRSDWQAALPTLTQIGNGSALLTCLDSMLGSHADRAFMQAAPLLGITLGIGGHLQCLVSPHAAATACMHEGSALTVPGELSHMGSTFEVSARADIGQICCASLAGFNHSLGTFSSTVHAQENRFMAACGSRLDCACASTVVSVCL